MPVYFNKVKLDRTSFLLTKRLAWASVTRTEQGVKDNFSKILLKRILPRIGRFLLSPYGNIVSSFDRSFKAGWSFHTAFEQNKASLTAMPGNISMLRCQKTHYSSSGVLPHLRRNSCPYSWIHLLHTEKKRQIRHLQIFEVGTEEHIAWLLGYWPNSHQTAKRLCSLPGPLSTTEPLPDILY